MEPEQLGEFEILAAEPWNHTGLRLEAGHTYRMSAAGEWFDRGLPYGPEGGPAQSPFQRVFEWARRRPHEPWFVLTGAIDADNGTAFRIGKELASFIPKTSGELTCYANDVRLAYRNNTGRVVLDVWRIE